MTELPAAFTAALDADREAFNARFAMRLRGGARIDSESFLAHLRSGIAPLIELVHSDRPERVRAVLLALYEAALDLFAASLLGPDARHPLVGRVWTDLLPGTIRLLAREPQSLVGCLCNAALHVSQQGGTRPEVWLSRMQQIVEHCESLPQLLEAGRIAAWQAGLVQYRAAALEAAMRLPGPLAARALSLAPDVSPEMLLAALTRLQNDPWLTAPAAAQEERPPAALACVATAGNFTGFGGVFARPPVIGCRDGRLVAADGQTKWEVFADAYGAWFRRLADSAAFDTTSLPKEVSIDRLGNLRWGKLTIQQKHLANATGVACDGVTLAVTIATSHHVFLFSRTGPAS